MNKKNLAIGVDIEDIERFKSLNRKDHKIFFNKVYTKNELEYCFSKSDPSQHLATRFAGKEAVIKIIKNSGNSSIFYNEIEIVKNKNKAPIVKIKNKNFNKSKIILSLSHSKSRALAFALEIKNDF